MTPRRSPLGCGLAQAAFAIWGSSCSLCPPLPRAHAQLDAPTAVRSPASQADDHFSVHLLDAPWLRDASFAQEEARALGRPQLVAFTGSDWCPFSGALIDDLLGTEEFLNAAAREYVLLWVDSPLGTRARSLVHEPARNQKLRERYRVVDLPRVLVIDGEHDVVAEVGFPLEGELPFVDHLRSLVRLGQQELARLRTWSQAYDKAEDDAARAVPIRAALQFLERDPKNTIRYERAYQLARSGLLLDLPREEGDELARRALAVLLACDLADQGLLARAYGLDPENEDGLFELALLGFRHQVEDRKTAELITGKLVEFQQKARPIFDRDGFTELLELAAGWNANPFQLNDPDLALVLLDWCLEIGPTDERAVSVRRMRQELGS
jgi:hypothetical protein